MECHHDVIPVPSPAQPPLMFFLVPKTNKKLQNLSKYEHKDKYEYKDDNVEKGQYDTPHGLIMAYAHYTTFYYDSLHCSASASATLVTLTIKTSPVVTLMKRNYSRVSKC